MRRWIWPAAGGALLLAIIIFSLSSGNPRGEKVFIEPVKRQDIRSVVSAPGQVDPKVKVNISANVIGKIEKLFFKEGDLVQRGQPLVEIEAASYVAQRDRLRSEVANRRIDVQRAQIQLANARRQYDRARTMQSQGIQAQELFDRAQFEYETALANLSAAQESVRQAAAGLAQANEELAKTTINSPLTGKVVQLNAQEGEVVITGTMNNPGSVIAIIADLSEVLIEAEVNESEVVRLRQGQEASVEVEAIPEKKYAGRVVEIGSSATTRPSAGAGVRYFKVKIALDQPDERLRPGMTAQVEIVTDQARKALAVPVQSVVERSDDEIVRRRRNEARRPGAEPLKKKFIMVVGKNEVDFREVTTGISDATHVAIVSGLKGDEQIVTGPFRSLRRLREGDRVEEQRETEPAEDDKKEDQ